MKLTHFPLAAALDKEPKDLSAVTDPKACFITSVTPTRETEIMTFDIGDIVGVSAVAAVKGGFSGAQRVYEYTIAWEDDGVLFLQELQTSDTADQ